MNESASRDMEESPPGRSQFQVNSNKYHLMVGKEYAIPEASKGSATTDDAGNSKFHRWPATEVYKPCSVPYSKNSLERTRLAPNQCPSDFNLPMWNDSHFSRRIPNSGSGVCPFGKFLSMASVVSSLLSFLMMTYLVVAQKWAKVSLPNHDYLSEGYLLLIQSAVVLIFTTFVAIIILYHGPVTRKLFLGIICGLMFMCISDQIWFWNEIIHNHDYNTSGKEDVTFKSEFARYFAGNFNGTRNSVSVPTWMHQIQISHKCCGSHGPEDWFYYSNGFDLPDSCCVIPIQSCGFGYFAVDEDKLVPSIKIFNQGCASSQSRLNSLTYGDLMMIQFAKFTESFIMLCLFIVLNACCKQGFVSTEEDIPVHRRRQALQLKKPDYPPHSGAFQSSPYGNLNIPTQIQS